MPAATPNVDGARPRSFALVGPYGSGKTTLFEALLAAAGAPVRRAGGPRGHFMTTELHLAHCTLLGDDWAILDCPGSVEFFHQAEVALSVVDLAVVVCEPTPNRALTVAPILKVLDDLGVPHLVFVNKIDTLSGAMRDTLAALQAYSRRPLVLRQVPIREDDTVSGYVDVVSERAYRYRKGQPSELIALPAALRERESAARAGLVEVLADHDDALLEKVLEDIVPSTDEIYRQLHKDQVSGAIVEVLLGAADRDHGVRRLWKALRHDVPDPAATSAARGLAEDGEPLVQVFRTVHAAHTGKLSYARIWRGPVKDGATLDGARIGGLYHMPGGEASKGGEARTGDLVALGRLDHLPTGATIGAAPLPFPLPPGPVHAVAIAASDRKDDVKLSGALQKLIEEDPTVGLLHDPETGDTVLFGQGEIHLNTVLDRLAQVYNLKVSRHRPMISFKETIRRPVQQHARLKRQTGGHGQFADVKLEIEPLPRGDGFRFVDRIVGGAVPRQYIPAVGEAAADSTRKGPIGYPVVDIAVTLVDGTFHTVDSSDMAFKNATRMAMAEGLAKGEPMLLEPIDHVTVVVPNDFTASAQRLLSGRRGQILGYAERPGWPGWDEVAALVPEAELYDLISELRSQTMGIGSYRRRFDHLAEAPSRLLEKVAQEAAGR